jgi:protein-tyrosine phosphatase
MMKKLTDLTEISKISDHIYLSGAYPLENNHKIISDLNIKYILCCVDKSYVSDIHNKILMDNPDITILYLPYDDDIYQNLWIPNKNSIEVISYFTNANNHLKLSETIALYQNKPLIEIAYHFINNAVSHDENILVHCMAGVSRSTSMVVYYFMKKDHYSFNKALKMVQEGRSVANPNDSFRSQLVQYGIYRGDFTIEGADTIIRKLKK